MGAGDRRASEAELRASGRRAPGIAVVSRAAGKPVPSAPRGSETPSLVPEHQHFCLGCKTTDRSVLEKKLEPRLPFYACSWPRVRGRLTAHSEARGLDPKPSPGLPVVRVTLQTIPGPECTCSEHS